MRKVRIGVVLLILAAAVLSAQTVTVMKPAAGETWVKGQTYTITWVKTGTFTDLYRISLRDGLNPQTEVRLIKDNYTTPGSCSWTVPTDIPDATYMIRVKVKNMTIQDDSDAFKIAVTAGPTIVQRTPMADKIPPLVSLLGKPALSISGAGLVVYSDSFRITFAYKNSGNGNLPKSSEMPVKPNFRVIVDGQVLNQGNLTIPAFPAPPGWEMPSYYGGEIKLPAAAEWDLEWTIGKTLTIDINENKVNGMASDTKAYDLKQLALKYVFDASIAGAAYNWVGEDLVVTVHIDGPIGAAKKLRVYSTGNPNSYFVDKGLGGFMEEYDLVPGKRDYMVGHKVHLPNQAANTMDTRIGAYVLKSTDNYPDQHDIDHLNNQKVYHFHR